MNGRSAVSGALLVVIIAMGCAKSAPVAPPQSGVARLRAEIDQILAPSELQRGTWAAMIQSLDNGETLYSLNPGRLMMPASNMKIVTIAAAAERLGWDHRFATRVFATGPIDEGVLRGDLITVGSGDPTITAAILDQWTQVLWDRGLRTIDGRIIGDDNRFDDEGLGAGWAWDYLGDGYAAPTGALEYNENVVVLSIQSGSVPGAPVDVTMSPPGNGLTFSNRLTTGAPDSATSISFRRLPGTTNLEATGSVRAGETPLIRTASIDNPTEFFVDAFRHALVSRGIEVAGDSVDMDVLAEAPANAGWELLTHESPPLVEIATTTMKVSQNAFADTLLKATGAISGTGSATTGRTIVSGVLEEWGVGADNYQMYDGSGLSRYNYLTAEMLVRILRRMAEDPKHARFASTLPIAGKDGTLSRRMRGTSAEGNARAKTGSIANVRTLSGYVTTADGESLVFSILANHFNVPQAQIDMATDRIVERLATLRRDGRGRNSF